MPRLGRKRVLFQATHTGVSSKYGLAIQLRKAQRLLSALAEEKLVLNVRNDVPTQNASAMSLALISK